jgi:hypothetical protein
MNNNNNNNIKYVLLLSREMSSNEKDELKKWFSVFSYSPAKCNNRTILELFSSYDVVCLKLFNNDDLTYYAENLKLLDLKENGYLILKIFLGKFDEESDIKEIISDYKFDYCIKKICLNNQSKDELIHHLMTSYLKKIKNSNKCWATLVKIIKLVLTVGLYF